MIGSDPEKRYYQDEIAIHQSLSRWHHAGELATFTTILAPVDSKGADIQKLMNSIQMVQVDRHLGAVGIKIQASGKTIYVCSKLDRDMDLHHLDRRPQYDYEHGKVKYDDFETDGHQFWAILEGNTLDYQSSIRSRSNTKIASCSSSRLRTTVCNTRTASTSPASANCGIGRTGLPFVKTMAKKGSAEISAEPFF
jgi:hypothetical protein